MTVFSVLCLAFCLAWSPLQDDADKGKGGEAVEHDVLLRTKDGSSFRGKCRLPSTIVVKTKYGDSRLPLADISNMHRRQGDWLVFTRKGQQVTGQLALGKIELKSDTGEFKIPEEDITGISIISRPVPRSAPPPPPPAPRRDPRKPEPAVKAPAEKKIHFAGLKIREEPFKQRSSARYLYEVILPLPGGKHVATLDRVAGECVFVELETGKLTRTKVENSPYCLMEREGTLYITNVGSNSISLIDAKTFKSTGRIATPSKPMWLAGSPTEEVLYLTTSDYRKGLMRVDLRSKKCIPIEGQHFSGHHYVTVSPSGEFLIIQGEPTHSPSATPTVYHVRDNKYRRLNLSSHRDHPGPFIPDPQSGLLHCGSMVYSWSLHMPLSGPPSCNVALHSEFPIVALMKRGKRNYDSGDTVTLHRKKDMMQLKEVVIGEALYGMALTADYLVVTGPTDIYRIPLKDHLGTEHLKKAEPDGLPPFVAEKPPSRSSISRASQLYRKGDASLAQKNPAEARKAFLEAAKLDPNSGGLMGVARVFMAEKKYGDAISLLYRLMGHPFREDAARIMVYNLLGIAQAQSGSRDSAVATFRCGLSIFPDDYQLLKNLGITFNNMGKPEAAYCHMARSLKSKSGDSQTRKILKDLETLLIKKSGSICPGCDGKGRHEVMVENERGGRSRIVANCDTCKRLKHVWKRPCAECLGSGRVGYREFCKKCWGRGFEYVPLSRLPR